MLKNLLFFFMQHDLHHVMVRSSFALHLWRALVDPAQEREVALLLAQLLGLPEPTS